MMSEHATRVSNMEQTKNNDLGLKVVSGDYYTSAKTNP